VADNQYTDEAAEVFALRLAEARAFGSASESLPATRPEFSARSGLTIRQRFTGWLVVLTLIAAVIINPDMTLLGVVLGQSSCCGLHPPYRAASRGQQGPNPCPITSLQR